MRKLITKFPKMGEEFFSTKVEVAYINSNEEMTQVADFLTDLGFEINPEAHDRITAIHLTKEPAVAEQTVRALGNNAFMDYRLPPKSADPDGHTDLC